MIPAPVFAWFSAASGITGLLLASTDYKIDAPVIIAVSGLLTGIAKAIHKMWMTSVAQASRLATLEATIEHQSRMIESLKEQLERRRYPRSTDHPTNGVTISETR